MSEWFECKVRYEKTLENGLVKKVTEPYLVDALSFTEAEKRFIEEIEPFMSGDFQVTDIKRAKYAELFEADEEAADRWFKAKVAFITLDEKSGADGLILGEIANYTDRFSITTCDDNQSVSVALNVTQLAKEWRSKDEKDHGFSLMAEGRAKALPEGKYKYNRWGLCNCHLVLLKENEGAHGAETAADTLRILSLAPDSLVLQDLHNRQEQETFIH